MSEQTIQHPYLRDGWRENPRTVYHGAITNFAPTKILPDVNPADEVVRRMRGKTFAGGGGEAGTPGQDGDPGAPGGSGGSSRINHLQAQINSLGARMDAASAVCNGDGTITFTI